MGEAWVPMTGEVVRTPAGTGRITHLDADTEMATVNIDGVNRQYAIAALQPGKPSDAWG